MADEYDLLSDHPNATFAVVFDVYTPRPHFIILPQNERSVPREFSQITNEQTQQLIKTGMSVIDCQDFKIDRGTLSIHRGSWKSTTKFHAHFCVEVENYLPIFESRKEATLNWSRRSEQYVTKEWRYSKDPASYAENAQRYPHRSYLEQEIRAIGRNLSCPREVSHEEVSLEGGITRIVYHPSHPKIGFVRTKPKTIEEFQQVLTAMEKFAKELGLTDLTSKKDEMRGCHICLYLGSVPTADWEFTGGDGEQVVGHIVMAGLRFYQLCPVDRRREWFSAYRNSDFKCLT